MRLFLVGGYSVLLFYYCTTSVLLYSTRPQTWSIVEGSVGWRQKSSKLRVFSLRSYLGVIGAWFRAFGDPQTPTAAFAQNRRPSTRASPQTPGPPNSLLS